MEIKCFNCHKLTKNKKYCSRNCAAKINNKIPKRTKQVKFCTKCKNPVKNNSTLCKKHHKERSKEYLLNLTIADYTKRMCLLNLHPSSKFAHIRGLNRSWNKDLISLPCYVCGYTKHVELAHIRPISKFPETALLKDVNSRTNVVQLCPNCHWEFDNNLISLAFPEQS